MFAVPYEPSHNPIHERVSRLRSGNTRIAQTRAVRSSETLEPPGECAKRPFGQRGDARIVRKRGEEKQLIVEPQQPTDARLASTRELLQEPCLLGPR